MHPDKQAFLAALAADRYDAACHKAFADWLYEHGEDAEAEFHAKWSEEWQEAEDYLKDLASQFHTDDSEQYVDWEDEERRPMTLEKLVGFLDEYQESGEVFHCGGYDWPNHNRPELWKMYRIYTGKNVVRGGLAFSCSC